MNDQLVRNAPALGDFCERARPLPQDRSISCSFSVRSEGRQLVQSRKTVSFTSPRLGKPTHWLAFSLATECPAVS